MNVTTVLNKVFVLVWMVTQEGEKRLTNLSRRGTGHRAAGVKCHPRRVILGPFIRAKIGRGLRGCLCKNHPLNFSAKLDFSYKLIFFYVSHIYYENELHFIRRSIRF